MSEARSTSLLGRGLLLLLSVYKRAVSPLIPRACRYHPTCSEYCREAIELHGALRGVWLGLRRLLRCHPFARGGFDPVPPTRAEKRAGVELDAARETRIAGSGERPGG